MAVQYHALVMLGIIHILALASLPYMYFYGVAAPDAAFHILAYLAGGFGITALYHRSWTHNAVAFARPIEYLLSVFAIFCLQMPARQWISSHVLHHHHTDTEDDPYNIQQGFWWAHFEWIIYAPLPPIKVPARLDGNPVIQWQEAFYWPLSVLINVLIPISVSVACGMPWWGGLLISSLRLAFTSHVVYSVNSICHWWGTRPFTRDVSARDVWWFPFALGEQYHNYHHAFPRDYRHGIGRLDFDPTKWLIWGLSKAGLARNLFFMPENRIAMARAQASIPIPLVSRLAANDCDTGNAPARRQLEEAAE